MDKSQQVIVLHGLGRSRRNMEKIAKRLECDGYRVLNLSYRGVVDSYEKSLEDLNQQIAEWINTEQKIHFVGHSFGGILTRGLLAKNPNWNQGRVVMLGTPNKGTKTASYMLAQWWCKAFLPKVTKDLKPDSSLILTLPEPINETGVIAGSINNHILIPLSWFYKTATNDAPGDGIVEIANTKIKQMKDFITMPVHHSFMPSNKKVVNEVANFLAQGEFSQDYK